MSTTLEELEDLCKRYRGARTSVECLHALNDGDRFEVVVRGGVDVTSESSDTYVSDALSDLCKVNV